jgi:CHAD domain-containing protein
MPTVRNPSTLGRTGTRTSTGWLRLIRLLRMRWRQYALQIRGLQRHGQSERRVHHYRVAAQRLLAVLRVCDGLLPDAPTRRLRRRVKRRVDAFRRLRDVQVLLLRIHPLAADASPWVPLDQRLAAEERGLQAKLRGTLRKAAVDGERSLLLTVERALLARARSARFAVFGTGMRTLAAAAQARTRKRSALLAADKPQSFHRTRLAIKRARYLLEIIATVGRAAWASAAHRSAKRWQDELGAIQDLHVLELELARYRAQDPSTVAELLRFRAEVAADRNDAIVRFLSNQPELELLIGTMVAPKRPGSPARKGAILPPIPLRG